MDPKDPGTVGSTHDGVTRRTFLGAGIAGGAALLGGGLTSILRTSTVEAAGSASWIEKSIP